MAVTAKTTDRDSGGDDGGKGYNKNGCDGNSDGRGHRQQSTKTTAKETVVAPAAAAAAAAAKKVKHWFPMQLTSSSVL